MKPLSLVVAGLLLLGSLQHAKAAEAVIVARGSGAKPPQQPQAFVDSEAVVHLTWGVLNDLYYSRSRDQGKSFSEPVKISPVNVLSLGMRRGPRIAVSGKTICISAIGGKQGKGKDGDLLVFRSTDGGQSWREPVTVNDQPDVAREGLHAMAAGPNGELACVWLDLRNKKMEVACSLSTDGAQTWSDNTLVYRSPDGAVCPCCHPSVAFDAKGKIVAMWRNDLEGNRDMYYATSDDGGKTFSVAHKLGRGTWPLDRCPMDGGCLALRGQRIITIWRREQEVFICGEQGRESSLGAGEQPWFASTADDDYTVLLTKRGESLKLQVSAAKGPIELAKHAKDPVLAAQVGGKLVVAAWEDLSSPERTIRCQVVSDGQRVFSPEAN